MKFPKRVTEPLEKAAALSYTALALALGALIIALVALGRKAT